ncbi:hypothetical protein J2X69_002271 [Algoriphagus sp. 4150]|nr:hypothetical protein [Algoriphagus sp. 4150]
MNYALHANLVDSVVLLLRKPDFFPLFFLIKAPEQDSFNGAMMTIYKLRALRKPLCTLWFKK